MNLRSGRRTIKTVPESDLTFAFDGADQFAGFIFGQPSAHFGVRVGGIVADDQVQIEVSRHALIKVAQEAEELLMSVTGVYSA